MRRLLTLAVLSFGLGFALPDAHRAVAAQAARPPITSADYGRFESLVAATSGGGRGGLNGLSPDGKWLVYGLNRVNQNNEMRIVKVADTSTVVVPYGAQAAFSSDSHWIAYEVGHSVADTNRLKEAQKPIENALGLRDLRTGDVTLIDGIQSFAFSPDGAYLAMRRYSPVSPGAPGTAGRVGAGTGRGSAGDEAVAGVTVLVRQLASGRDTTFGNVSAFAWQEVDASHLLALTINAEGHVGNGVQLFDPETTVLRVLDSAPAVYSEPTWREHGADLAVFRAKTDPKHEGPTEAVLAWTGLGKTERAITYDPTTDTSFAAGMRTVAYRRLSWSEDGARIFLGVAPWPAAVPAAPRTRAAVQGSGRSSASTDGDTAADEPAGVDIWNWQDVFVQPRQKLSATADARRSYLAAWLLDENKLIVLGHSYDESIDPMRHGHFAVVAEWSHYAMDRTIGRPAADMYLEDELTGTRTELVDDINDRGFQVGPADKMALFLRDDAFWAVDLTTHATTNITKAVPTSFIDKESDETIKQKPAFGVAGWTPDDRGVLLYDKYDLWLVPTDGTKATRLTNGAADQIRHRLVHLGSDGDAVDLAKPTYVSLFGLLSKKSGYGRLGPNGAADRLLWLDQSVTSLAKARTADVFSYMAQDYDVSPNLYVGGPDFKAATRVTNTNAFQMNYAWGKSQTVDFTTDTGMKLQGSLYYPAGYVAGRTYPMIVYVYERLSDNVHRYVVPSDHDYYNITVFLSQGYFVFEPDITFHPRQPGLSVVECVTAGVKKVVSLGAVDAKRVGAVGHSWGGFDTTFLATHTNGVFAAAVAGAPITGLVSNYGNHHWSSGIAETDHIETGQQRMEVPLYEDLADYVANSAVFNVANMTVPLLIEVGDADGTVFWHQGIELYNIARRARKTVVLLEYEGEDHGLRQTKNQADYQRRILAWFGHYLKGDDAPRWMTTGETYLERQDEVRKQLAGRGGGSD